MTYIILIIVAQYTFDILGGVMYSAWLVLICKILYLHASDPDAMQCEYRSQYCLVAGHLALSNAKNTATG